MSIWYNIHFHVLTSQYGVLIPTIQRLNTIAERGDREEMIDPINWIAIHLMRANTKHHEEMSEHPYNKMLQEHVRKVKHIFEENRAKSTAK
jgi:hypothetical protein